MSDRTWWRTVHDDTTSWHMALRWWRVQVGYHVHRHTYFNSPDRWAFQPFLVYDCAALRVSGGAK